MVIHAGKLPVPKGEPVTGVSAPLVTDTVYAEMLLAPQFTTYANWPVESTAMEYGFAPAAKGEPATGAKAPLDGLIEKTETSPEE